MALFCMFVSICNHKHTNQIVENASNRDRAFQPELEIHWLHATFQRFNNMG